MVAASPGMPDLDAFHVGMSVLAAGTTYGPYDNPFWEFSWIIEGGGTAEVEGITYDLRPNSVLLIPPYTRNFYTWVPNHPTRQGLVLFHAGERRDWPRSRSLAGGDIVLALFQHAVWLKIERPPSWEQSLSRTLDYCLTAFVTGESETSGDAAPAFSDAIQRTLGHLQVHWRAGRLRTPPLRDLAEAAGMSREHLCRVFAKEVGMGPVSALRLIRVSRAATLLAQTNLAVSEVSRETGFESEFHFSRVFKATTGMSPSAFRSSEAIGFELPAPLRRFSSYL